MFGVYIHWPFCLSKCIYCDFLSFPAGQGETDLIRTYCRALEKEIQASGDTSWLVDEATDMLATGKGNCYSYASAYCMLVRAIGVDAIVISGHVGANFAPHGWVEIERNGEPHIFDTELSMAHPEQGDLYYYDRSYAAIANWSYVKR